MSIFGNKSANSGDYNRTNKPIFDAGISYTRSPQLHQTSPSYMQNSPNNISPQLNHREPNMSATVGVRETNLKQWKNPMFSPELNDSVSSSQKRIFREEDKQEEVIGRSTIVSSKLFFVPKALTAGEDQQQPKEGPVIRHSNSIALSGMRPTIQRVQSMNARDSNIPKERMNITSPTDKRPLQPYFKNKKIIVTGASSGIGRATAIW